MQPVFCLNQGDVGCTIGCQRVRECCVLVRVGTTSYERPTYNTTG